MNKHVTGKRIVQVFKNGRSRAVRIPKEFDFEGTKVEISQLVDGTITMVPVYSEKRKSWEEIFAAMEPLGPEDAFPDIDDSDLLPLRDVKL